MLSGDSSVGLMAGFLSPAGERDFSLLHRIQTALGPTQPPVLWVPGVKRHWRNTDHSPSCHFEVRNDGIKPHVTKCCNASLEYYDFFYSTYF
jgi:hypothetical protein